MPRHFSSRMPNPILTAYQDQKPLHQFRALQADPGTLEWKRSLKHVDAPTDILRPIKPRVNKVVDAYRCTYLCVCVFIYIYIICLYV